MARILFIHKVFPLGGAEVVTINIANGLTEKGHEVHVVTPDHRPQFYPHDKQPRFHVEVMPRCNLKLSLKAARFLRDYILSNNIDIVVSYREILYMPWLKRQTGAKFIYVLHSMVGYEFVGKTSWFDRWFYRAKYQRIFRQADVYGVLCQPYIEEAKKIIGTHATDDRFAVLPNSVDLPSDINTDKKKECLFVGRLTHRDKRADRLLRIWQKAEPQLAGWTLNIVGTGPDEANLKALADTLGLKNVCFKGHQNHVKDFYDTASVLCLTSSFEGWPMTIAEAQANGVIPILFDSFAGSHDLIGNPDEGCLIPPFDEDMFANELVSLCKSHQRQQHMRDAVISKASTYSINRTIEAWLTMLSNIS